ncbi:unnamed protein product [Auanema sp. JU1783]|nr:unnamed protein product [Auanema sp. JU1783]
MWSLSNLTFCNCKFTYNHFERLTIAYFGCCSVFDTNDNDPESNCLYHCENTVMIPSLHPREKIRRIRKCMMTNFKNTVYKCFVKCQASRRVRSHERFQLERHCNMTDFMRANQFYYGAAVLSP